MTGTEIKEMKKVLAKGHFRATEATESNARYRNLRLILQSFQIVRESMNTIATFMQKNRLVILKKFSLLSFTVTSY
jgi:hypothetical protein